MNPTWKITALVILLLSAIVMLVIATSAPQLMLAQAPLTTPTPRQTLGPGGTVTPPVPTFTPPGPGGDQRPTAGPRPTDYVFKGPTVTPSGPLIALDTRRPIVDAGWETDNAAIARIYRTLPKSVGSLQVLTYSRDTFYGQFDFGLDYAEGKGGLGGTVDFYGTAQQAYNSYAVTLGQQNNGDGRPVDVGDAAFVAPEGRFFIAIMRYRNVFVEIYSLDRRSGDPARVTLTEQQLTDVLTAIVKALDQK